MINSEGNKQQISIYFEKYERDKFLRWDVESLANSLNKILKNNYNINIIYDFDNLIANIYNIDVLIMGTISLTTWVHRTMDIIAMKYPDFFNKMKIITIKTDPSWEYAKWFPDPKLYTKETLQNFYITLPPMTYNKDNNTYVPACLARVELLDFIYNLIDHNNVTEMGLFLPIKNEKKLNMSKKDFFKKYKLDTNKKNFTFFLKYPFFAKQSNPVIDVFGEIHEEEKLLLDTDLLIKITNTIRNNGYNVLFKPHPGRDVENKKVVKPILRSLDLNLYGALITREDDLYIDCYTDLGIILYQSAFNFYNYILDIPLLKVSNENKDLENNLSKEIKYRCSLKNVCYGSFTTLQMLKDDTDVVIKKFINEYGDKPQFDTFYNNPIYGTSYIDTIDSWAYYIKTIVEKPLKINNYTIFYPYKDVPNVYFRNEKFNNVNAGWIKSDTQYIERPNNGFCDTNNDTYVILKSDLKKKQYEYAARKANMTVTQYKIHRSKYLQALKSMKK